MLPVNCYMQFAFNPVLWTGSGIGAARQQVPGDLAPQAVSIHINQEERQANADDEQRAASDQQAAAWPLFLRFCLPAGYLTGILGLRGLLLVLLLRRGLLVLCGWGCLLLRLSTWRGHSCICIVPHNLIRQGDIVSQPDDFPWAELVRA